MKKLTAEDLKRTSKQAQRYADAIQATVEHVADLSEHRPEDFAAMGGEGSTLWLALQFVVARYLLMIYPKANVDETLRRFVRGTKHQLHRLKLEKRESRDSYKF